MKYINENSIFWDKSLEELKKQKFKRGQRISFICKRCGKLNNLSFGRIKKKEELVCQSCLFKEKRGRDTELGKKIKRKVEETNLKKYGVPNPSQNTEIAKKIKETNLKNHGGIYFTRTQEYIEKTKRTNIERYKVEWAHQSKEIIEKGKQTCLKRYGVKNPSQIDSIQKKKIDTNLKKYGTKNPSQNDNIKEKIRKSNLEKYGVSSPSSLNCIKEKIKETNLKKYGVEGSSQKNFLKDTRDILFNKEKFERYMRSHIEGSTHEISLLLRISDTTLRNYIHKYSFENEFFYRIGSSYEMEIRRFLKDLNVEYINNIKSIINPLELDIYIPSKRIAIEFNGNYWHSSLKKDKFYHQTKTKLCEEKGIQLIQIFEYEWDKNKDEILSYLRRLILEENQFINEKTNDFRGLYLTDKEILNIIEIWGLKEVITSYNRPIKDSYNFEKVIMEPNLIEIPYFKIYDCGDVVYKCLK